MAVFNPGNPGLTPQYGQIIDALNQTARLERGRPSPLMSAGTSVFETLGRIQQENRSQRLQLAKEERERQFELQKFELEEASNQRKELFKASVQAEADKIKAAREAREKEKERAHERRGELQFDTEKTRAMEAELGLEEGMLSSLEGRSLTEDEVQKVFQNASKEMVARIKAEPGKDTVVARIGGKDVTYGETMRSGTQRQRLQSQLVRAGGKDTVKDISGQEFPGAGGSATPNQIKGAILQKALSQGFDTLTPDEARLVAPELEDPTTDQALKMMSLTGMGFGKGPEEIWGDLQTLTAKLKEESVASANGADLIRTLGPAQKARVQKNVDDALRAIQNKENTYEEVIDTLRTSTGSYFPAIKSQIDKRLNR